MIFLRPIGVRKTATTAKSASFAHTLYICWPMRLTFNTHTEAHKAQVKSLVF